MVRQNMLQSVIATVNRLGLKSLRLEDEGEPNFERTVDAAASIWAVLDSADLADVRRVLQAAEPELAFRLLSERAVSRGCRTIHR